LDSNVPATLERESIFQLPDTTTIPTVISPIPTQETTGILSLKNAQAARAISAGFNPSNGNSLLNGHPASNPSQRKNQAVKHPIPKINLPTTFARPTAPEGLIAFFKSNCPATSNS
jgi:hypothetical protein